MAINRSEAERRLVAALDTALELGRRRGVPTDAALAMAAAHAAGALAALLGPQAAAGFLRQLADQTERLPAADAERARREPATRPGG